MSQCLVDSDSFSWIKSKHLLNEINSIRVLSIEDSVEVFAFSFRQLSHELFVLWNRYLLNQVVIGVAYQIRYLLYLVFL
jgi:hypothetical protein